MLQGVSFNNEITDNRIFITRNVRAHDKLELVSQFDAKVQSLIEERLKNDVSICLLKQWFFCTHQKLDIALAMEARQLELNQNLADEKEIRKSLMENVRVCIISITCI